MSNNSRTLVKLDDTIIEIRDDEKGLWAKKLTPDEVFEVSLLDEGVEKLIENDVNQLANDAYSELQESFKRTLKGNVLRIVGFEDRWDKWEVNHDKWEVNHCNGRHSALTEYMSNKVQQMFSEEFDKLLQPDIEKMLKPMKKVMVTAFKDAFQQSVREQMRTQAQEAARSFLSDVMSKEVQKFQKQAIEKASTAFMGRKLKSLEDPVDSDE
jgi:hypothetical protein